jgi:hypothetical protein
MALQRLGQGGLLEDHLGAQAYQLAELAHVVGRAGQAHRAADLAADAQRQIDARLGAMQLVRGRRIDFGGELLGQRQQCAGMQLADPRRVAAGEDHAVGVHHVDVERDDAHGAGDDFLGEAGVEDVHGGVC